jgi:hypothetical protein
LAFESLPGIKIKDPIAKRSFILADFFSVYENVDYENEENSLPDIYHWSDFLSIVETKKAFILKTGDKDRRVDREFVLSADLIPDPRAWIRVRAIIEGAVAANPDIEYTYGKRILPPKTLCLGCDISTESYIATGIYDEGEINNSNVVFLNPILDKLIWAFAPLAAVAAFAAQVFYFGEIWNTMSLISYAAIAILFGLVIGISAYLFSAYAAKTLYRRLLKEDPALLEEITFVICEHGFIAAESRVYDFSDIIPWHKAAYFMETNHMYIIFGDSKAVFWMPKRLFPKEVHHEIGDYIADRLLMKPLNSEQEQESKKKPKEKKEPKAKKEKAKA